MSYNDQEYFAIKPTDEIAGVLHDKVEKFYQWAHEIGRLHLWFRAYEMYHVSFYNGGLLQYVGEHGEYTMLNINHFRNILQHLHVLATYTRPAFQPKAVNTDHKSQAQTLLADSVLEYYMRDKRLERYLTQTDEDAVVYGEGYLCVEWDENEGEIVGTEQVPDVDERGEQKLDEEDKPLMRDQPVRQGDVVFRNFTCNNIIRDINKESWEEQDWVITRAYENKYEIAARYPELADHIVSLEEPRHHKYLDRFGYHYGNFESDQVPVYTFYHAKTVALPEGRIVKFLDEDLVLLDGPLPYNRVPLFREAPAEQTDFPLGYSSSFDLMAIQEALDILYSIILTNQKAFGVQSVMVPRGSNLDMSKASEGLVIFEYDADTAEGQKPEPLNLTFSPREIFEYINMLVTEMERISGINSVSRGEPDPSLKSGSALALVQSMAIQFSSGQQNSYARLIEDVGTHIIDILKLYATTPRMAAIAGKTQRPFLKEFTGEDLANINRVVVDVGNPMMKTAQGRMNVADHMVNLGLIQEVDEYLSVFNSGRIEPLIEGKTSELMNIRSENEALSERRPVAALAIDDHVLHIMEHKSLLATPENRLSPEVIQPVMAHIQEHLMLMRETDPGLLLVLGQQPLTVPALNPGSAAAQEAIPPREPNENVPVGQVGEQMTTQSPIEQNVENARPAQMPKAPENPLTGQRFNLETGGM